MRDLSRKLLARQRGRGLLVPILVVVVILIVGWGVFSRVHARSELRKNTEKMAEVTVTVTQPTRSANGEELVLPGTVDAFVDASIYARTSGYLKRWLVDIGTPVKAGQLLAEIDAPEVDQQLNQAIADLAAADANNSLAQSTAKRYKDLLTTDSVAKQDAEDRIGDAQAKKATAGSARANVARLQDLESFKRVIAPFDGIVTARNTDVGQLIAAGGGGPELFHVADIHKLRVYVQVPQAYAGAMSPGIQAELHFTDHPDRKVPAVVVRTANAIDPTARTLLTQLEVDNPKAELMPGGYADVRFKVPTRVDTVRVPANTLLFGPEGMRVAVVDPGNGKVAMKRLVVGRDFGTEVEALDGVKPDDQLVLNPPDSLVDGATVKIAPKKDEHDKDGNKKKDGDNGGADKKSGDPQDGAKKDDDKKDPAASASSSQEKNGPEIKPPQAPADAGSKPGAGQ